MTTETRSLYSQLPAIDRLLRDSSFLSLRDTYGHTRVVELLRQMLDEAREVIRDSQTLPAWCENWAQEVDARLTKEAQSALRPVINDGNRAAYQSWASFTGGSRSGSRCAGYAFASDPRVRSGRRRTRTSRSGAGAAAVPHYGSGRCLYR